MNKRFDMTATGGCAADWRDQLAEWLLEWNLDRALRIAHTPTATDGRRGKPWPLVRRGPPLIPGDIRLLAPNHQPDVAARPLYVSVLQACGESSWRVVPFGRLATPAVPGEWRTGQRAMPLRVLCLWNARTTGTRALAGSWCAGHLPPRLLSRARELDGALPAGRIPAWIRPRDLGPPLRHPSDPRWTYLAEEADTLEEALDEDTGTEAKRGLTYPCAALDDAGLLKAAEPRSSYGPAREKGP